MKIYTLIYQKPLRVKTYSSLVALFEDNSQEQLGVSKAKLDRFDFDSTYYVSTRVIITRSVPLSSGDVRRKKSEERL
ncbi:hypothetical protein [Dysgonomonas macrotermitis]|uniref:Uncharacterized protein n=1 Tax=Dysgonomonas macrotermitis TaxID=1346286 RepID=A0A1M5CKX3_9BACT|nr:hypothetical protein [Dysgonomonas macrotermitis]SHF55360.1 hypothetical protein SAMN05444362_107204 [Dysgonomonas macrotermitis]